MPRVQVFSRCDMPQTGLPSILLLLLFGFAAGPVTGFVATPALGHEALPLFAGVGKQEEELARAVEAVARSLARQQAVEKASAEATKSSGRSTAGRAGQRGGNVKRRKR